MSIEQLQTVDMIADNVEEGEASLVITDHLPWDATQPDHLLLLQEKINSYISFFESGEIFEGRAHLRDRRLKLKVVGLHPLSALAEEFYERARPVLEEVGLPLVFELSAHALE
jgi:hypothetical protein